MPVYEKRYRENGVPAAIQCILMKQRLPHSKQEMHYHDYVELLFGLSGCANAYVGTEAYPLRRGTMLLVHNNVFHTVDGNGEESEYIVVKFLPSVLFSEEASISKSVYRRLLEPNAYGNRICFFEEELEHTDVPSLFLRLMEEWNAKRFGYELSLRADLMSIVLQIMRLWQESNPAIAQISVSSVQGELIRQAIEYVDEHYADLTEDSCARALGVSAAYLSRVFKRGMQATFCVYLNRVRLKAAEKLLVSGEMSMTEIAERVGFSSVSHFIAAFRRSYRVTPGKYRRILRGEADAINF